MPKRVRMVAEIVDDNCTGCRICEQVCPTVAITMRDRRADEPGPGKKLAVVDGAACYNAQACFEVCPDDAIVMRELDEPFDVGMDMTLSPAQQRAVNALCAKAGYPPDLEICYCTTTYATEIAAAVLAGASTPDEVSLATGARTGCLELCLQPVIDILHAAGHANMPRRPKRGFQWYGRAATLRDNMTPAMRRALDWAAAMPLPKTSAAAPFSSVASTVSTARKPGLSGRR